jgi:GxxExxY protein
MDADRVTAVVIGDAIAVHREVGPGLLESTYEACLASLLKGRGLRVERQVALPVVYRGQRLDCAYRVDLRVAGCVIVELKSIAAFDAVHFAQMNTYLRHSGCTVGLLLNFNAPRLVDGLRRVVRNHPEPEWRAAPGPASAGTPPAHPAAAQSNINAASEDAREGSRQPGSKKSPHPEKMSQGPAHVRSTR